MSNSLALVPASSEEAYKLAARAVASKMFASFRSPEEAFVVIMTGAEMGMPPMQSLRSFHVINGRAVPSADMLAALVRKSGLCKSWRFIERTDASCTLETLRAGEDKPERVTWTIDRATRAGVTSKQTWKQYPAQMLAARCIAELARQVYPDVCAGMYLRDEIEDQQPQHVDVRVMSPDEYDPEREAIQAEAEAPSQEPTLAQRLRDATTREEVAALRSEIVALPSGSSERRAMTALYSERLKKFDAPKEPVNG